MDMSILTGIVSEEELHHERPEYLARLHAEGQAAERAMIVPANGKLWRVRILGFIALIIGLSTLVAIIWSLVVQADLFGLPQ